MTKSTTQTPTQLCPCRVLDSENQLSYAQCCEPIIKKKASAKTAVDLMRARYSAFAKHEVDFIVDSHHPKTRGEVDRQEIEAWSKKSEWLGLEIHQTEAGLESDQQGMVIFHAQYNAPDTHPAAHGALKHHDHWEQAVFEKHEGQWFFLDAQGIQQGPIRRSEPKIGRNDPCPCGSGKKYKKCHLAE